MECLRTRQEVLNAEPSERLAVVRCEDDRCVNCTAHWVFLIDDKDAGDVIDDFWVNTNECLDASVEITTVADFLAGKRGDVTRFSVPLGDREADCESCGRTYAVWRPGVDPCPFCGTVPEEE